MGFIDGFWILIKISRTKAVTPVTSPWLNVSFQELLDHVPEQDVSSLHGGEKCVCLRQEKGPNLFERAEPARCHVAPMMARWWAGVFSWENIRYIMPHEPGKGALSWTRTRDPGGIS